MQLAPDTSKQRAEKIELIKKIDTFKYKSESEKQKDQERVGELEKEILDIIHKALGEQKSEIVDIKPELKPEEKLITLKAAKRLLRDKYEYYRILCLDSREFTETLVRKKEDGRKIMEIISSDNFDEKKAISEILMF